MLWYFSFHYLNFLDIQVELFINKLCIAWIHLIMTPGEGKVGYQSSKISHKFATV